MKATCALAALLLLPLSTADAATIVGTDTQNKSTSYTTGDGLVTLFAYSSMAPLTAGSFNVAAGYIGVNGGNNNNGVDDGDGNPATLVDREAMDMQFGATVGLSQLTFGWSRADGPDFTDGIMITGFLSDPGATGTGVYATAGQLRWDDTNKILYAETTYVAGVNGTVSFSNLAASAGQTLRLTANDSNQTTPVGAIQSIGYEAIPEPGSLGLLALGGLTLLVRRRQR